MLAGTGMGADFGDLDLDGDFDLCQTNIGVNYFWMRQNETAYRESSGEVVASGTSSALNVNWVCRFFDYDLDGDLDIYVTRGHIIPLIEKLQPGKGLTYEQPDQLLENDGRGRFRDVSARSGASRGRMLQLIL